MKVLLLGATGVSGKGAAALLAHENLITEIGLASRHLESAQRMAAEIGAKAHAVCLDIKDLSRLTSIAADYDIIVNNAGPTSEVQVPGIQAAIGAGVHYCDLGVIGKTAQSALQLDSQAQAKGVTAIISSGWFTIMSLMATHAAHKLDETEQLSVCMLADYSPGGFYSPEQSLARARELGHIETNWDFMEVAAGPVFTYREGQWGRVNPLENPIEVLHPSGHKITAYLTDTPIAFTLPHSLPGVQTVSSLFSITPPPLNKLFLQQSQRISRGETDLEGAVMAYLDTALADKERWFFSPPGYPSGWWMWAIATGNKNGRKARYMCWPSMFLDWTNIPLIIVALRILRGEVSQHGVLPPEACFELESFFQEAAQYLREEHRGKPLLNECIDFI